MLAEAASPFSTVLRDEASLNIIIPMGGKGEAFREAGYTFPGPLIKIVGRPILLHLLDNLKLRLGDVVWLVVPEATYLQYESHLNLKREFPDKDIRVVPFKLQTRGAAETLFIGLQHMSAAELNRRTICLDCANLYFSDVLGGFRQLDVTNGCCFYFDDRGAAAVYSYLRVSSSDVVKEVREKHAISRKANIGAYGFPSGAALRATIQQVRTAAAAQFRRAIRRAILRRAILRRGAIRRPPRAPSYYTGARLARGPRDRVLPLERDQQDDRRWHHLRRPRRRAPRPLRHAGGPRVVYGGGGGGARAEQDEAAVLLRARLGARDRAGGGGRLLHRAADREERAARARAQGKRYASGRVSHMRRLTRAQPHSSPRSSSPQATTSSSRRRG